MIRYGLGLLFLFLAVTAWGQVYISLPDALSRAFGKGIRLVQVPLDQLAPSQLQALEAQAGSPLDARLTRCYQGQEGVKILAYLCLDNMRGKTENITYLLKISHPEGIISQMEVMIYRESEGDEIRNSLFLRQFLGKGQGDPLRLNQDVQGISGATYSSRAMADGARKLLVLYRLNLAAQPLLPVEAP